MPQGYSLHIGMNYVSPLYYQGWDGRLASCVNDATYMKELAESLAYSESKLIKNKEATIDRVIAEIGTLSELAKENDLVLITYSGHGGQVLDLNGDEEEDGKDETWALYDAQLIDDKIFKLLQVFREGVRVIIVSDSCHSGSVFRPMGLERLPTVNPVRKAERIKKAEKIEASVRLLAACQDHEYAATGSILSSYTKALKQVWNKGQFHGNFIDFNQAILATQPFKRNPTTSTMGKHCDWLENGRPFII